MLDIKLIRNDPEFVRKNLERRGDPEVLKLFDEVREADFKWRETVSLLQKLREERNRTGKQIAKMKKSGENVAELVKKMGEISREIEILEEKEQVLRDHIKSILMRLPNLLHESVPFGEDENDNVVIRTWGSPPKFDFEPRNHLEICEALGLIDRERASKVSGRGFLYLRGKLVLLDMALQRFAMDFLIKRGFIPVEPPFMMRTEPYEGVTDLADFEDVLYKVEGYDLRLIATSEHPIAAMFKDEVLLLKDLPLKFAGISPCFRKEVGTHGKYTKGLFRMHHFNKVEQFVFCHPDESWKIHEQLQENAEKLLQDLGLHYRVVNVCTGDIGVVAAKKYDIEVWMADGVYREIVSNSNCTDYQARRLNIRWRKVEGSKPEGYVHTLNSTAIATSRTMIAIIEQYQQEDGTVKIPRVLRKYCGFNELSRESE
ncbi:MAG: serine--tRNA ligase [Candidatus Micrarchaeota archaeon]|nr:serine--tRNA ligase [Candidatus Micrarchaeota archaeon]